MNATLLPRSNVRALLQGVVASALCVGLWVPGCATSSTSHQPCTTPWQGRCRLAGVKKVAERATPIPSVTYEALFEPIDAPASAPPARVRVDARALHEAELRAHLEAYPDVACEQSVDAQCFPGEVVALVPAFEPPEQQPEQRAQGCAQLEAQSATHDLPTSSGAAPELPESLSFDSGSPAVTAQSQAELEGIAARLLASPELECVAIVAQGAPGDEAGLAERRAWAVRRALQERGVPADRLQAHPLQPVVYGAQSGPIAADPKAGTVYFRVLIQRSN